GDGVAEDGEAAVLLPVVEELAGEVVAGGGEVLAGSGGGGALEGGLGAAACGGEGAEELELDFVGVGVGGAVGEDGGLEPLGVVALFGGEDGGAGHAELRQAAVLLPVCLEGPPDGGPGLGEIGVGDR